MALLGVAIVSATLMTVLAYSRSRAILESEIRANLESNAAQVIGQIDAMLFERVQNIHGWRRLDVMEDTRIGDVDKRLANFLTDTRTAYGNVYAELLSVDTRGIVVASSSPASVGRHWLADGEWTRLPAPYADIEMRAPAASATPLVLRAPMVDAYGHAELGVLYAVCDWQVFQQVLDLARREEPGAGRIAAIVDAGGQPIALSAQPAPMVPALQQIGSWQRPRAARGTFSRDTGDDLGRVEVGYATSRGFQQWAGTGWTALLIEPKTIAFAKSAHLLWALMALLAVTMLVATLLAISIARRIAWPIQSLTAYTRRVDADAGLGEPVPVGGEGEIRELTLAFAQMVEKLRHSQAQLVHAAKLTVVGEMAAVMAHEVRTPLGILRSAGQLLAREPNLSAEGREMVEFVLSETARLNRLVTTLIDCARPRPPHMAEIDLGAVLASAVELAGHQAGARQVRLTSEVRLANPSIYGDAELLLQVFLNLLMNAAQIVPAGGDVLLAASDDTRQVVVTVEDSGPGIAVDLRQRIFDPFVSFREGGIGLGLTVVRQIVAAHRGTIDIGDSRWSGAMFRIVLPRPPHPEEIQP